MFTTYTKTKFAVIALTATLAFSSSAQAEDTPLENYIGNMVSQAMIVTQQELKNSVRSTVLTMASNINFNEEKSHIAKVSISEVEKIETSKTQAE